MPELAKKVLARLDRERKAWQGRGQGKPSTGEVRQGEESASVLDPVSTVVLDDVERHQAPATTEPEAVTVLRQAYRNFWSTSQEASELVWKRALAEIKQREQAVPGEEACRILREEAERFHGETGCCPFCGKTGPLHSVDQVTRKGKGSKAMPPDPVYHMTRMNR